ncbi:MAG: hypothetical protein J7L07_07425 [Candidatus Odinarchaeota archaeon]|nr:hypothetical protein [Candidatus Odinarchaeota archaeon]
MFGDLRQTGMADEIINVIKDAKVDNPPMFEFFESPSKEFLQKLRKALLDKNSSEIFKNCQ